MSLWRNRSVGRARKRLSELVRRIKMCLNEAYSKVRIGEHSYAFPFQSGLVQGDALSTFLFTFSDCAIRKVHDNKEGLELDGTHQLLVYVDAVNLLGENINIIRKKKETGLDASKEVDVLVNAEISMCSCLITRLQEKISITVANK
jgi:hypothetical protein